MKERITRDLETYVRVLLSSVFLIPVKEEEIAQISFYFYFCIQRSDIYRRVLEILIWVMQLFMN